MEDQTATALLLQQNQTLSAIQTNLGAEAAKNDAILKKLDRIEDQTTKTNGRVNALEKWRSYLTGAFAVVTTVVLVLGWVIVNHGLL